ncbi:hypothetical protein SUGI_0238630 [Cryptomeria japonica]|nr:hypothetical protein SUGI_0238630 [Cryptomeria japonica]
MDALGIIRKRGRHGKLCKNPGYENLAEIRDLRVRKRHCGVKSSNPGESTKGIEQTREEFEAMQADKTNYMELQYLIKLPSELQLKIMEYLNPVDVARVSCVCKELRITAADEELWKKIMAADEELWKKKSEDKFGKAAEHWRRDCESWKDTFNTLSMRYAPLDDYSLDFFLDSWLSHIDFGCY